MSVVTATISSTGKVMDPAYELLSIDVSKEVNRISDAQLVLLDGDVAQQKFAISDTVFFEPGKEVEIKLRYEGVANSEATVFKGLISKHSVAAGAHGSLLTIDLKDAAIKLTQIRKSEVYRDQSDDKIIATLIQNHGLKKGVIPATQPKHPEIVQYYCTDWDFMLSRTELNGLLVLVSDGEISAKEIAISGAAKHSFEYGISEIYDFEMEADAGRQRAKVESIGWDVKQQKLSKASKAKAFKLAQGNLKGDSLARAVGADLTTLTNPVPMQAEELKAWADSTLARNRMALLRGRLSVPGTADIKLLDVIEISGVGKRFNGKTIVTGIRHRVNQLNWRTDLQFGLSADSFSRQPDIVDTAAAGLLPAVNGLHIGIVDKFEEDPDKQFRVKVILPGIDEQNGTVWARLATPDAGKQRGYFFRPETGDEVVVGFFNDDPRQPVILGALYSSKNVPPKGWEKLSKDNLNKGIVSKAGTKIAFLDDKKAAISIETPHANKFLLSDDAESIEIADQHGNTITMNKEGVEIKSAKDLKIDAGGNVEIKGTKVDVK